MTSYNQIIMICFIFLSIVTQYIISSDAFITNQFQTNQKKRNIQTNIKRPKLSSSSSHVLLFLSQQQQQQQYYYGQGEDLYSAVHRKEYEMKALNKEHETPSSPLKMAISYIQDNEPPLRLARALRRVYEDPENAANPNRRELTDEEKAEEEKYGQGYKSSLSMRRGCFVADIKRKSLSRPGETFCHFDDAGVVAAAMVDMGADCVFINIDYRAYGGDVSELRSAVRAVRKVSQTAAVVMKDIIVDEIQLGLAKDAGCDGVLLIASVLGPSLENFLNLCSVIGLESIVECHTTNEVNYALDCLAQNVLVSNYDRVRGQYFPEQATNLAGLFPGSGGPIISLAGAGIETVDDVKEALAAGYDGVVVGKAIMGNTMAPEFIKAVKEKVMLPAEFSGWELNDDDVDIDMNGNVISKTKESSSKDIDINANNNQYDDSSFQ